MQEGNNQRIKIKIHKKFKCNFILKSTLLYIAAQLSSPTKRKMCLQLSLSFACHLVKFTAHSYAGGGKSGGGSAAWPGGWGATVAPRRRLRRRGSGEGVLDDRCNSTTYTFKHMNS